MNLYERKKKAIWKEKRRRVIWTCKEDVHGEKDKKYEMEESYLDL